MKQQENVDKIQANFALQGILDEALDKTQRDNYLNQDLCYYD